MLNLFYANESELQIGVDEAGRGCFAGPVCCAAVIWDMNWLNENSDNLILNQIKDSKKISEKKRQQFSSFIKDNALSYGISMIDSNTIDEINILQASIQGMHLAIKECIEKIPELRINRLIIDGTQFKSYKSPYENEFVIPHVCVTSGDNLYLNIASASILAKVERDNFMKNLCIENPEFDLRYKWKSNKGYGTKDHINGIKEYGITSFHRKTFGMCKNY